MSHSRIFGFIPNSDSNIEHINDCISNLFAKSGLSINRKSCDKNFLFIEAGRNSMHKSVKETRFVVLIDGYITNLRKLNPNIICHATHLMN